MPIKFQFVRCLACNAVCLLNDDGVMEYHFRPGTMQGCGLSGSREFTRDDVTRKRSHKEEYLQ